MVPAGDGRRPRWHQNLHDRLPGRRPGRGQRRYRQRRRETFRRWRRGLSHPPPHPAPGTAEGGGAQAPRAPAQGPARKLRTLSGQEARFRKDVNHTLSKTLVAKAQDTGRGLALEDLKGIRDRTRFRKAHRARMGGWAFHQLRTFIAYKAQRGGVMLEIVDPRNTSRECAVCGYVAKTNRPSQAEFRCGVCGHTDPADVSAARNIRSRAGAAVDRPKVSEPPHTIAA
ncbi:RNA-guided endonuclease InsQ/TnpB family protein [Acidiferrobacter thiooxydans]|uniref:RNA-guided endonuclease InsQ/TnpB family protein n=1 Tax=Acidiferrobacter thiooxydans TaxID=163359 RepID=UPI001B874E48